MALPSVLTKSQWPFSPQIFPSCLVWLDVADRSSYNNQSTITTWRNKGYSGGNTIATSGTFAVSTSGPPTLTVPVSSYMTLPSITFTQPSRTFCMVITVPTVPSGDLTIVGGVSPSVDVGFTISSFTLSITDISNGVQIFSGGLPSEYPTNTRIVFGILPSPDSSISSGNFYINGVKINPTNNPNPPTYIGTTNTQTIGSTNNTQIFNLNEIMLFDGSLLNEQRQQLEGYLAAKWGLQLSLPLTHPYYKIPAYNRPFQPIDIGGCGLWFDAADKSSMVLSGASVTQWNDKSGNGRNATSGATRPTYSDTGFNGSYPGVTFSGTSSVLTTATFSPVPTLSANGNDISIFVVYNDTGNNTVFSGAVSLSSNGTPAFTVTYGDSLTVNGTAGTQLFSLLRSAATSLNTNYFYVGGALGNSSALTSSISSASQTFQIGPSFNSSLAELIIYNGCLQLAQRRQVEAYLAQKWRLVAKLTTGHPGKLLPPFTSPFSPKTVIVDPTLQKTITLWLDGNDPFGTGVRPASGTAFNYVTEYQWFNKATRDISMSGFGDGSPPIYPRYDISYGYGSMLFDASSSSYFGGSVLLSQPFSIFIVAKNTTTAGPLYTTSYNDNSGYYPNDSGTTKIDIGDPGNILFSKTPSTIATGSTYIHSITADVSGGNMTVSLNGSGTPYISTPVGTFSTLEAIFIGVAKPYTTPSYMTGNMYEIISYNFLVSTFQRQQIEGYLAWKWGLVSQLPPSHTYAKFAP